MPKVISSNGYHVIKCKPCGEHLIPFNDHRQSPNWQFNGDYEKPTFSPSVRVSCNDPTHPHYQPRAKSSICHFFVTDGNIAYCGDCTHDLKDQTVPLEEFTPAEIAARHQQG